MLRKIIGYLETKLSQTGLIEHAYKFAEMTKSGPGAYISPGEFEHINLDQYLSMSYHRLDGEISFDEADQVDEYDRSMIVATYPMIYVACISRTSNPRATRDAYSKEDFANTLAVHFRQSDGFAKAIEVCDALSTVKSVNINPIEVFKSENEDREPTAEMYYGPLIKIEYEVTITNSRDCWDKI